MSINASKYYPSGSTGGYSLFAPGGTVITSFSAEVGTIWSSPAGRLVPVGLVWENTNLSGNVGVVFAGELGNQTWSFPVRRGWSSATSRHIARVVDLFIQCSDTSTCVPGQYADARLRVGSIQMTFDDQVTPTPGAISGSLLAAGWKRGRQTLSFRATDGGGGVHTMSAAFSSGTNLAAGGCLKVGGFYGAAVPCPLDRTANWTVDTAAQLADGEHTVTFKADDVGGRAASSTPRAFKVDNHAPNSPLAPAVSGGSAWRSTNGFDLAWTNPAQQHAPIVAAHWRICPAGRSTGCSSGTATSPIQAHDVMAPAPGEWDVRVWLEDAAGNGDSDEPANASAPIRVRWDPYAPALTFRAPDPDQPALAVVDARDSSGLAAGAIEIGRLGGDWQTLPTVRRGNTLEAAIPDERLAAGAYRLRAHAVDAAGNEGSAEGPTRILPIRFATRIRAGALARVKIHRGGCDRRGRPRCRSKQVSKRAIRVGYGRTLRIAGTIATVDGQRLRRRPIDVIFTPITGSPRRLGGTRSSDSGSLRYALRAGRSGLLSFRYAGDRHILPSRQQVRVSVPAPISIHTRDRRLYNGQAARFSGRIRGGAIPAGGKLIEIQAHFRGKWRTISTTRSDRRGRWRFGYTFGGTTGTVRYSFRARVPAESGYPFAAGSSKAAKVTVRGL